MKPRMLFSFKFYQIVLKVKLFQKFEQINKINTIIIIKTPTKLKNRTKRVSKNRNNFVEVERRKHLLKRQAP